LSNEFRITQTEQKLERDRINTERLAIDTHRNVGREVREAIKRINGTMPELLPAEPDIKKLVSAKRRLELKSKA
jgi:DNA-damage-inducible protein D